MRQGDRLAPATYLAAIRPTFLRPWIAITLAVLIALLWLVPERRIDSVIGSPRV
jgi:hypothetical protein